MGVLGVDRYVLVNDGDAAVLRLDARSVATDAFTATVTVHDDVGVIVKVYGHAHAQAKPLNVPLVTVTSQDVKLVHTLSLHDTLTGIAPLILAGDVLLIVGTGGVVSFLIVYVLLFVGHHHVSLILIITFVTHSAGVNHVDRLVQFATHVLPQFNENATAVLGDGHAVSVHVHVIAHACHHVTLCVKFEHVNVGAVGALVSTFAAFEV